MSAPARVLTLAGASVQVFDSAATACRTAADAVAKTIQEARATRGKAVLGLATGGTPLKIYERLATLHKTGELSFKHVATYNLDEYYPIHPGDPNSYRNYMYQNLFRHVDLAPNRAHVLDGTVPEAEADAHAAGFDRWIAADGGIDLQLLGIGRNGHIGFNEPTDLPVEDAVRLPTRLVGLHPVTVADAAKDFGGASYVIPRALTMGVVSILDARAILVVALGAAKAEAVAKALTGPITARVPASLLQTVPGKVAWLLDLAAARDLPLD